jgi:hypothetical protein
LSSLRMGGVKPPLPMFEFVARTWTGLTFCN